MHRETRQKLAQTRGAPRCKWARSLFQGRQVPGEVSSFRWTCRTRNLDGVTWSSYFHGYLFTPPLGISESGRTEDPTSPPSPQSGGSVQVDPAP